MLMRPKELQIAYLKETDDNDTENKVGYYPVDKSSTRYQSFERAISPAPQGAFCLAVGLPIVGIGNEAFKSCTSLVEVALPTNITSIAARAFVGCEKLTNVICEGHCVIDVNAFEGCTKLKNVFFLGGCQVNDLNVGKDFAGVSSSMSSPTQEGKTVKLKNGGAVSFASMTMSPIGNLCSDGTVKVSMSASHGCKIIYTLDGSEPREGNGEVYHSALRVTGSVVVKAASFLLGHQMTPTKVLRVHNGKEGAASVQFMPVSGTHFKRIQMVELLSSHGDAEVFYTLDGSQPTDASPRYQSPIAISETTTIRAIAYRGDRTVEGGVYEGKFVRDESDRTAEPVIFPREITEFDHSDLRVWIECETEGAKIYYTVNGRNPLKAGKIYDGPFNISESTTVRAIAVCEEGGKSQELQKKFTRIWHKVATPRVASGDKVSFSGSKVLIAAECETVGAEMYYSLDGVPTKETRIRYTGSIEVASSTKIYFVAVKDDWRDSEVVSVEVEKVWQYGDGVGDPDRQFATGGARPWARAVDVSHGGAESVRSGKIADGQVSRIETKIDEPGMVSFWWKASCEDDGSVSTADWDHLAFLTNDVEACRIDGNTDWINVSVFCGGPMTLRWEYVKDESESAYDDCGWVSDFSFRAARHVDFDPNGGSLGQKSAYYLDGVVKGLPEPVRPGCAFVGWFRSKIGIDEVREGYCLLSDITLYAHWGKESCLVTFDSNGGVGEMASQLFPFGKEQAINISAFKRDECYFAGWALASDGEVVYADGQSVSMSSETGELTLYAKWSPGVVFDSNGYGEGVYGGLIWQLQRFRGENEITGCWPQLVGEDLTIPARIGDTDISIARSWTLTRYPRILSTIGEPNVLKLSEGIRAFECHGSVNSRKAIIPPSVTSIGAGSCFWAEDEAGVHRVAWTLSGAFLDVQGDAFGAASHTRCVVVAQGDLPGGFSNIARSGFRENMYFWCKRKYYDLWVKTFGREYFSGVC